MERLKHIERATNPTQYDSDDLDWEYSGNPNSPRTKFLIECLESDIVEWKDKYILDIGSGSGSGWLLNAAKKAGAKIVLGIEPSRKNVEKSKINFPDAEVLQVSLENFDAKLKSFDIATSILSLSHISNLRQAFNKVSSLLKENGEFVLLVPDFVYSKMSRNDYQIEIETINDSEYVALIKRQEGIIADILRKNGVYINVA